MGLAVVHILKARGARVMGVARSESELASMGVSYVTADLGTEAGCNKAVEETIRQLGPIEIFVCNHGLGSAHERVLWETTTETWRQTLDINLDGPFYLTRAVMRGMVESGYGRIVYTSSTAASVAEHAGCAYNSSKAGLLGLMRSAATDGGAHGVTANAVLPGWVRTAMAERSARAEADERAMTPEQVWDERGAGYFRGSVATPEEVAEMIAFFASEESSGVSGESVRVALGSVS
ncbi:MAG: SDR family oxidoreductase [Woeseiaceae bacterium]|nr:SDR family oxidoreductase [Woeseiaceae bacterium]